MLIADLNLTTLLLFLIPHSTIRTRQYIKQRSDSRTMFSFVFFTLVIAFAI